MDLAVKFLKSIFIFKKKTTKSLKKHGTQPSVSHDYRYIEWKENLFNRGHFLFVVRLKCLHFEKTLLKAQAFNSNNWITLFVSFKINQKNPNNGRVFGNMFYNMQTPEIPVNKCNAVLLAMKGIQL